MLLAWLSRRLAPKRTCDHCRHFHHFQALADGGVGRFRSIEVCRNPASPFHNLPVPPARTCEFFEQTEEPARRGATEVGGPGEGDG